MVRVFGLLIALAMSTGVANAALLATWNFNGNANGVVAGGLDASASAFENFGTNDSISGNNGAISSGTWVTSAINKDSSVLPPDLTRGNVFSVTNTSGAPPTSLVLQSLMFDASTLDVPNTVFGVNSANISVFGSLNGGAFSNIGSTTVNPLTTAQQVISFNKVLAPGDTFEFLFSYTGLALTTGFTQTPVEIRFDNLTLNGSESVVPEPASMACFAGLFAVGAFRRLRKRS